MNRICATLEKCEVDSDIFWCAIKNTYNACNNIPTHGETRWVVSRTSCWRNNQKFTWKTKVKSLPNKLRSIVYRTNSGQKFTWKTQDKSYLTKLGRENYWQSRVNKFPDKLWSKVYKTNSGQKFTWQTQVTFKKIHKLVCGPKLFVDSLLNLANWTTDVRPEEVFCIEM